MSGSDIMPPRRILSEGRIDALGEAIIALTREIWVLHDRQAILEAVLIEEGVSVERLDSYQPDEALTEKLAVRRKALIDTVMATLRGD